MSLSHKYSFSCSSLRWSGQFWDNVCLKMDGDGVGRDKMSFEFEGEWELNLLSEVEPAQLRWWVFQSSWNTNCVPNLDLSIWWCWNRRWWWWWWWWWWWCDVVPWQLPQRSQEAIHGRAHVLGSRSLNPEENQDFHCDTIINNYDISNLKLLSAPSSPGWKLHRHLRAHSGPWWEEGQK